MTLIRDISNQIEEELQDAKAYADDALYHKESYPDLAQIYAKLADDEMGHVSKLHEQVAKIIQSYKSQNGSPPDAMQAVYDYLHQKHIDKAVEVRTVLDMFRR